MDTLSYTSIGKRIRHERKKKGMSQEQLADAANLSLPHISHIETANTKLGLPTLVAIANALDVSADSLLCDCLNRSHQAITSQITELVEGCSPAELQVIRDTITALRTSLDTLALKRQLKGK